MRLIISWLFLLLAASHANSAESAGAAGTANRNSIATSDDGEPGEWNQQRVSLGRRGTEPENNDRSDDRYKDLDAYEVYFVKFDANKGLPEKWRHVAIFIRENHAIEGTLYHVVNRREWHWRLFEKLLSISHRIPVPRPPFVYEKRPDFWTTDDKWEMTLLGYIYPKDKLAAFEVMAQDEGVPINEGYYNCQDWVTWLLVKVGSCTDIITWPPRDNI